MTTVVLAFAAIALTGRRGASEVMSVPVPSGCRELKTYTGIPRRTAGAIVLGCSTFAPNDASSLASSKRMRSMSRASGTTRGSAVSMPSTSVQISIASACSAAPNERRAVVGPAAAERGRDALARRADEAAHHRHAPLAQERQHALARRARRSHPACGSARLNSSSVTITWRASTCSAGMPRARKRRGHEVRRQQLALRGDRVRAARRAVPQHAERLGEPRQLVERGAQLTARSRARRRRPARARRARADAGRAAPRPR